MSLKALQGKVPCQATVNNNNYLYVDNVPNELKSLKKLQQQDCI